MFFDWLRKLRTSLLRSTRKNARRVRPGVEPLEERWPPAAFTAGNLAVLQTAPSTLATNTTASIIELTPTGTNQTPVQTLTIEGSSEGLRFSGSATSTGYLSHSSDGTLLTFTGANSTNTTSNVNTLNPRTVGTYSSNGTFALQTTYTGNSGNQTRSATTLDNSTWFIADQGGLYTNGTTAASPTGNFRGIKPFGGTVYVAAASGTATVISVSTLSAPSGSTAIGLPGLTNNANTQDFYLIQSGSNGSTFDVLYLLTATSNTAGVINKFSIVDSDSNGTLDTWMANGTFTTTFGGFGLAAQDNGDGAFLYVTTGQGALTNNSLLRLTDGTGYNQAINISTTNNVTLYTATGNAIIKGVDFAPNSAPVANPDTFSVDAGNTLTVNAPGVLGNDTDANNDTLTAALVNTTTNGTLTFNTNGSFTYTPNSGFSGSDSFTYTATDGVLVSNVATVTINVNAGNTAPVANPDTFSVDEDNTLTVSAPGVLGNDTDADNDTLTATLTFSTSNGSLSFNADGSFTYTPNSNFFGSDLFTYKANDGTADSSSTTVIITVNAIDDAPVANPDSYSVDEDGTLTVPTPGVLGNDTDTEGDGLAAILDSTTTNGTLTLNNEGSFTYTPNSNFNGTDSFTYKISTNDGTGISNVTTVTINVNAVNDAPVAVDDSFSVDQDDALTVIAPGVLGNDTDVDSTILTASVVSSTSNGVLSFNSDGSFSYTPNSGFSGTDSFTYRANDGELDSNLATVTIAVNGDNQAPVAVDDSYTVNEDEALTVSTPGVLGNDTDADNDPLIAALVSNTTNGVLNFNNDGSFTYTPNSNFNGTDSFTYKANDGTSDSNVATVTINVTAVNDAPVANPDSYMVDEDGSLTISAPGVLGNDTDIDSMTLTATLVSTTSNGSLSFNADGSFTYTPNSNFNGSDSFTYKANDGDLDSEIATVTITINAVNDAPVANPDSYMVNEDGSLTISAPGVLGNDTDVDNTSLTAIVVSTTTNGTLSFNADGSFTYTPNSNFNGSDSFTYKANDGELDSEIATVTITVNAINDAPVANADSYMVDEDGTLSVSTPGVLGNDTDVDSSSLTATLVNTTSNGSLSFNADGSFTYTPNSNFNGSDSFTYKANDGELDSEIATVTITVNAINDAPVANPDSYMVNEDGSLTIVSAPGVLGNDTDVDNTSLTAIVVSTATNGTLTLNSDGSFTYTPNSNFNGTDSFTYKANDGSLDSNIATVTITVNAVNDAPVANPDSYMVDEDGSLTISAPGVLGNDTDVDSSSLTATLVSTTSNGSLSFNADGSFTYTPNSNFNGTDSFTYKANDGELDSEIATVTITINAVNDAPVANPDSYMVNEDGTLVVITPGILGNDTDVDSSSLTATLVSTTANGSLTLNSNGSFTYTPNSNFNGTDSFTYKANDGSLDSNVTTVTITVNAVNDAPVANPDSYMVDEDNTLTISAPGVLVNDTDVESSPLSATLLSNTTNGLLSFNSNGSFTYTPNSNFNGTDSFTYKANDGSLDSNVTTVTITVNAVNDAPVANPDSYMVDEDNTLTISVPGVLGNDTDVDNTSLTAIVVNTTTNGTLTLSSDGSFTYTPNSNFNGTDSFTYKANDGSLDSNVTTVTITVNAVNDAPVANPDSYMVDEDGSLTISAPGVLGNDTDVENSPLTATLVSSTANGTLSFNADGSFTYTPNSNFNGTDSFTYKANDGALDSNVATVTITVKAINDAPIANDDSYNVNQNDTLTVNAPGVLGNDTDVDNLNLTTTLVSSTTQGKLTLNPNGSFTYTPNSGFSGTDSFTYQAKDGITLSNLATVTITVNKAPTVVSITSSSPSPTFLPTAVFTVVFSENVSGVDASDFAVVSNGLSGASVQSVVPTTANVFTVTVSTGSGPVGSIRLDFIDNDSVTDAGGSPVGSKGAGNGNFVGQTLTVIHKAVDQAPIRPLGAGPGHASLIRVIDATTGGERFRVVPFGGGFLGGVNTASADVNGDGFGDILAASGTGTQPHVQVFDGRTGALLQSFFAYGSAFRGGVNVGGGDVNADGFADVITGSGLGAQPHVKVFDGRSGRLLMSFLAYGNFLGGVNVSAGDVNFDGFADIITGSGRGTQPHTKVFDGRTGALIQSFFAYDTTFLGGVSVAAADVNADGFDDIFTGAGPGATSHIKVFDGRSNAVRSSFIAFDPSFRGGVQVSAADTTGDGRAEVMATAGPGGEPGLMAFDALSGQLVDAFFALADGSNGRRR